ncbi:MAG: hypothetical protein A3C06_03095 [Candidatus Taylorbacteria bacterium RIFCSPHIGHO2_02_FULL_46_13]|uniref:Uncharacterized protein n=1 Tax=Candidatus Taylorbacteria bacterium RIFCSPHIGHO2_02_FULL_46_13 TaxID=1802312 RepID=A0A1G2MRL1_9BACT|nr:MAG: hypothetical protein A3C06_03095 [Candidatus Taylorbacteria bacterium RIFCSPHIGHO2_02_FULL_46_13]
MVTITIPKTLTKAGELVLISKKELNELIARAGDVVKENDILRWSREAKVLRKNGKLPVLRSLRSL